jgi:hypothetical protein
LDFGPGQLNIPANAIRPDNIYGDGVEPKLDGMFRLAYGNIDGFSTLAYNNPKANVLKHWLRTIDADFFCWQRGANKLEDHASLWTLAGTFPHRECFACSGRLQHA